MQGKEKPRKNKIDEESDSSFLNQVFPFREMNTGFWPLVNPAKELICEYCICSLEILEQKVTYMILSHKNRVIQLALSELMS